MVSGAYGERSKFEDARMERCRDIRLCVYSSSIVGNCGGGALMVRNRGGRNVRVRILVKTYVTMCKF